MFIGFIALSCNLRSVIKSEFGKAFCDYLSNPREANLFLFPLISLIFAEQRK